MKAEAVTRRVGLLNRLKLLSSPMANEVKGQEEVKQAKAAASKQGLRLQDPEEAGETRPDNERGESVTPDKSRGTRAMSEPAHLAKLNYDGRHANTSKVNAPFK